MKINQFHLHFDVSTTSLFNLHHFYHPSLWVAYTAKILLLNMEISILKPVYLFSCEPANITGCEYYCLSSTFANALTLFKCVYY